MNQLLAWVWLAEVLGPCSVKLNQFLERYPQIEEILEPYAALEILPRLAPKERERAEATSIDALRRRIDDCARGNIAVLGYGDARYPQSLRETAVPPAVIYVTGKPEVLSYGTHVAGVGSRYITQYGRDAVEKICAPLVEAGVTLVSGLALGIDTEVHKVALKADGVTVAVLGNEINTTVPTRHREMRSAIEHKGAVVSEYPPGAGCMPYMFPMRNRIIAGLARAVVIFEAALKSGTMITANWALDDGREVLAVPGNITSSSSAGTNRLIKQGATPATAAEDVFEALGVHEQPNTAAAPTQMQLFDQPMPPKLSGVEKEIYELLYEGVCDLDDLVSKTGNPPSALLPVLTMMELDSIIEPLPGGRYGLKT